MDRRGFTLVEILVALAALGLVSTAFILFFNQTNRTVNINSDRSSLVRSLKLIEEEVMRDIPFIPPQRITAFNADTGLPLALFDDPAVSAVRCYNKFGGRSLDAQGEPSCANFATDNGMQFQANFFKHTNFDRSIPGGVGLALKLVPVSLVRFRILWKQNGQVDPNRAIFFTRIVTESIRN